MPTDLPRTDRPAPPLAAFRLPVEPGQPSCPLGFFPADHLFQGRQEVLIAHKGETYRLRITKNGKLILTK
ncbi:MAG: hemin uptake protein HemP [Thiobacillus sp.]|nr:hemin uptake protein HemP [Thiobacillus sp.]